MLQWLLICAINVRTHLESDTIFKANDYCLCIWDSVIAGGGGGGGGGGGVLCPFLKISNDITN